MMSGPATTHSTEYVCYEVCYFLPDLSNGTRKKTDLIHSLNLLPGTVLTLIRSGRMMLLKPEMIIISLSQLQNGKQFNFVCQSVVKNCHKLSQKMGGGQFLLPRGIIL